MRRILVAASPHRDRDALRGTPVPCAVGVLPWSAATSRLTVVVRAAWGLDPLADAPLSGAPIDAPRLHAGPVDPAHPRADDFVPLRPVIDAFLVGSLDIIPSPGGRLEPRHVALRRGKGGATIVVEPSAPGRTALRPPSTRRLGGAGPFDPGPRNVVDRSAEGWVHQPGIEWSEYQAAPPELQLDPDDDADLTVSGLDPSGREITLAPPLEPRIIVDYAGAGQGAAVLPLFVDGLVVDAGGALEVSWRGHVEVQPPAHRDVDRLILVWATPAAWRDDPAAALGEGLRELPHGTFSWAWEREDALKGEPPPPLDEHELTMARYESWDYPDAPQPRMEIERFAAISAELGEQREPRGDVLKRHDVDDYAWSVEERAWAQALSGEPEDPAADARRAAYARELRAARAKLATPREEQMTREEWVELSSRVESGNPQEELARAGLGLGGYLRLDEAWRARAEADPELARTLEELRRDADRRFADAPLPDPFPDEDDPPDEVGA